MAIKIEIYPLTITMDRYSGTYSHGKYLAWRLDTWEVPREPFLDDVTCMEFWDTYKGMVGLGKSPELAEKHLKRKLYQRAISLQKKYGGPLYYYVEAVELCKDERSAIEFVRRKFPCGIRA